MIGGSGFIGSHIVRELLRRGKEVKVFDRCPFPPDEGVFPSETVLGDILDPGMLRRAMHGCDTVFHLAGNPQLWDRNPQIFDQVNRRGTENVVRAARQTNIRRLVYTSSETTLAPLHHNGPIVEETRTVLSDMIGPYCRSKFLAQQAVLQAAREGFPAVVVIPTLPIGPGDRNLTPPGRMILNFLQGKIPGYIDCTLNFVDVRDVALGHLFAADKGQPGGRYILSGHNLTLTEFFSYLSKVSGRPPPRIRVPYVVALAWSYIEELTGKLTGRVPRSSVTGVKLCKRSLAFDGRKTWEVLGHRPRRLEESIRDTVLWHKGRMSRVDTMH